MLKPDVVTCTANASTAPTAIRISLRHPWDSVVGGVLVQPQPTRIPAGYVARHRRSLPGAWIVLGDEFGSLAAFRDNLIGAPSRDDRLDLGELVSRRDDEQRGGLADRLILGDRKRQHQVAIDVRALTEELEEVLISRPGPCSSLFDSLVDGAKHRFVLREALLPCVHRVGSLRSTRLLTHDSTPCRRTRRAPSSPRRGPSATSRAVHGPAATAKPHTRGANRLIAPSLACSQPLVVVTVLVLVGC